MADVELEKGTCDVLVYYFYGDNICPDCADETLPEELDDDEDDEDLMGGMQRFLERSKLDGLD